MMIVELDKDNLSDLVAENDTVLVQYSAGWCGNCRIMKPKFKKFAQENENATFVIVDAEKYPESRKLANVDNLPTFAAFRKGEVLNQIQTNKTDVLKSFIDEATHN
ncbi:MAG TPA: thioredoxin family protein [Sphingobacteriaceae bacterium]|nr:thioredoxin family protein [Sphingobacteriaceae bacterium]